MMRRTGLILVAVLGLSVLAGGALWLRSTNAEPRQETPAATTPAVGRHTGVWVAPVGLTQTPIWPGAAPGLPSGDLPPESVLTALTPEALDGPTSQAVFEVTVPTMTVFPARGTSTGAAIVVFPGGGFMALAITIEGTEICNWVTAHGITCILSKYRVPKSGHHYDRDCDCGVTPDVPQALQDAQRTIRLVRSRADDLGIDPTKIGVMGFSAGGYLVAQTSNIFDPAYAPSDAIDRVSSRPDFAIAFFPGHLCRPGTVLDPGIRVTARTPPTFLLQAWDDPVDDICNSTLYARALDDAGVPTEVHLFAKGGHAFGLRRPESPDTVWPGLLETWLQGIGILAAAPRVGDDHTG